MKYMIMTFGDQSGLEGKSPEWIKGMIAAMEIRQCIDAPPDDVLEQG
jgi:hypothetical protein